MKYDFWVSSLKATFWISIDENNIILDSAPIAKKFIGQPMKNLTKFFKIDMTCRIDGGDIVQRIRKGGDDG